MDEKTDKRPLVRWKCKGCGRTLGVVERRANRRRVVKVLMVPCSGDDDQVRWLLKSSVVTLEGTGSVSCVQCGAVREWVMGQEQLDALVERVLSGRE